MLPCIACSKQVEEDAIPASRMTPKSIQEKEGLKSITHQFKDMVVKASIAYRHCKPGSAAIFDDDPPLFDESLGAAGTSSGPDSMMPGNHVLTRSISKSFSRLRSIKSQATPERPQATKDSHGRSPRSPAGCSAYPHIAQQQLGHEQPSVQDDAGQEWVAQVEPGVLITFLTLPNGGNELKRIRFSRNLFSNPQAEAWWMANSEKVHELYNVSGMEKLPPTLPGLQSSKEVESSNGSGIDTSPTNSPRLVGDSITKANAGTIQSLHIRNGGSTDVKNKDGATLDSTNSNGSEYLTEDEPGVYVTVKVLPGGVKALKRVRFSCDKFDEQQAKLWWEKNRFRIQEQYVQESTHGVPLTTL